MMQEMIKRHIQNQVKFKYILADSWYSSAENMRFVEKRKKVFIFELKENRLAADSESKRDQEAFGRLELLKISEEKPVKVWIKDLKFPVISTYRENAGQPCIRFYICICKTCLCVT